jgi:hypothetical protein
MKDTTTSCSAVRDKLPLFVGEDLERDGLELVSAHLVHCEECAAEAGRAASARDQFRAGLQVSRPGTAPALWGGIRAALVAEGRLSAPAAERVSDLEWTPAPRLRPVAPSGTVRRVMAFAAAAAVLAVASVLGPRLLSGDDPALAPGIVDGSGGAPIAANTVVADEDRRPPGGAGLLLRGPAAHRPGAADPRAGRSQRAGRPPVPRSQAPLGGSVSRAGALPRLTRRGIP